MQLSRETIEEFRQIYKEEFGEEISDREAHELGSNLISLYKTLWQIECKYRLRQKYYQQLLSILRYLIQNENLRSQFHG